MSIYCPITHYKGILLFEYNMLCSITYIRVYDLYRINNNDVYYTADIIVNREIVQTEDEKNIILL